MKLEDTINRDYIIGIPSGEVISIEDSDSLINLKFKKLVWIKVMGTNSFAYVFNDKNLNKIKKLIK